LRDDEGRNLDIEWAAFADSWTRRYKLSAKERKIETRGGIRPKWSKKRAARNAAVRVVPILVGSLFLNSQATAQSVNVPDEQGGASRVDEIVVTAQKRAESLQDVPIAITAVSGSALEERNITQPQQLTLIDPSVRFRTSLSSNTSALAIRGIGTSVFSPGIEQSISTVVDGVVYAVPASLSTLNDIERVEILRGPQGMLFGKNASGGLVHFVTKRPRIGDNSGSVLRLKAQAPWPRLIFQRPYAR